MSKASTKAALGIKEETVDAEVVETAFAAAAADPANQEIEVFRAPDESGFRRGLIGHELMAWVAMQASHNSGEDVDTGMRMFEQVASAATLSEALAGKVETVKSKEILDTALACDSIKFMMGDQQDGCPYFAILDVRYGPQGTRESISIGGWMAIGQLARAHYQSADLPADSQYRCAADTPGAWAPESYPHYFKIKQKPTPNGHMNYLAPAV